ncbi:glutamine amidotransferase [Chitinimonas sp. BJYL2]|uniref:glutamine amidotransferase n=1 Tax=Chitinimonas sp. BJYL2 TaxID=2976696 RepID=UPI0022B5309D|nr:glutamine amidotransferase [Chitinimonas sp. BJYL2]
MSDFLYLGDNSLKGAAAYLAGVLDLVGWSVHHVGSQETASATLFDTPYRAYVISDYPAQRLAPELQARLLDEVARGAGLIMIGGWASFQGSSGGWHGSPLAAALPVVISPADDRINCDQPVVIAAHDDEHPVTRGLPWSNRPSLIGGFNRVQAKADAQVLLDAVCLQARWASGRLVLNEEDRAPLLVCGQYGQGRVAALATDVAPHWVGPWVDWGTGRVRAQAPDANPVEVGDLYARFLTQLGGWLRGEPA